MTTFNVLLALHVLGVVWWIGGVALVTAVMLTLALVAIACGVIGAHGGFG